MAKLERDWVIRSLGRLSDADAKVFGAGAHRFRLNPPLPETDVRAFEVQHRIRLPADYRGFLSEVGNGGAGPFYGLFPLGQWDGSGAGLEPWTEGEGLVGTLALPFPHRERWNDLSGMPAEGTESAEWERQYLAFEARYWDSSLVNGAMPICHEGCAHRIWLVVAGAETGHLWSDGRAGNGGVAPLRQLDGSRVTFASWYAAWLEEALLQLPAGSMRANFFRRAWRRLTGG